MPRSRLVGLLRSVLTDFILNGWLKRYFSLGYSYKFAGHKLGMIWATQASLLSSLFYWSWFVVQR